MADLTPGEVSQRYSIILGGVNRGMSNYAIMKAIRGAGLGLRRSALQELITDARKLVQQRERIAGYDYSSPIPQADLPQWPSRTQTGFGHLVQYVTRGIGTGEINYRTYTAISSTPMTPQQAIEEAIRANQDNAARYESTIIGAMLMNVVQYVPKEL